MKKSQLLISIAAVCAILAGGWIAWNGHKASLAPVAAVLPDPARAVKPPEHPHSEAPGFDRRETGLASRQETLRAARSERQQAAARLVRSMPLVRVDFDERLKTPSWIGSPRGFLTGADGQGGAVPPERAAAYAKEDTHRAVKAFMAEHATLFGAGPEVLDEALVTRDYVTPGNGLRTTVWQQQVDGVRVFESTLQANITSKGELVNIASRLVPDARAAAAAGMPDAPHILTRPPVPATSAISLAAATVGDSVPAENITASEPAEGASSKQKFAAPSLLDVSAEFVWLPQDESAIRLCWEILFTSRARGEMFRTLVDAATGDAVLQQRLTEYISPASYRVFTSDSPTPMSPGHATPLATQPPLVSRQLVTLNALNPTASPNGWIDDGITETWGNNVDAHLDLNADNLADIPRPQSSGDARVFDPPLDLTQAPSSYGNAAVVNLFYWNNLIHDRYYALGFTEAAGNFQVNNFGRGGAGNDAVQADAQDGSGTNNANFSTPADGSPGRMQMYQFTGPNPDRDGDFDQEITIHEYTHGLSNRLVGGGVGISAAQSRGMGEGWSDFYSLCLLSEAGDDPTGTYAAGAYASYQLYGLAQNYYFGIRRYPYCSDLLKNPLTFKDIDPAQASTHAEVPMSPDGGGSADEVHNEGEVWCVTLWDVRANLIAKYGAVAGNERTLRLVTDGMKLAPANPNFVQARDGILQAELVDSNGADHNEIWAAFAKRGLGAGASSPSSSTTTGLVENYDLPDTLSVTPGTLALSSGSIGGPFTPASHSLSLYNSGTADLTWNVTCSETWLSFSHVSGTLAANGQIAVEATLNAAAALLPAGNYSATVAFGNPATGISQTRTVTLHVDYVFVPLFHDGFESGTLDPAFWTVTGTGPHRTRVTTENEPHSGTGQLTMDSATDATYARNEATLSLDLTERRNLVLRFWVKMFDDEPEGPPPSPFIGGADFDGVAISADGTNWFEVQPLRSLTGEWQQLTVDLDTELASHGLAYGPDFKIRFNHYDNYGISTDGFAFDDVTVAEAVNRRLQISLPAAAANEGSSPLTATVTVTPKPDTALHIDLSSSDTSEAVVPASMTIPAGAGSATFVISFPDDSELDGTRTAKISATAETYVTGAANISVNDTETAVITLDVPPAAMEGSDPLTGTIHLSAAPAQAVRVAISSDDSGEVVVPAEVEVPAGQISAPFSITVVDDGRIDGTMNVTLTAHVANWTDGTATLAVGDNETRSLAISAPGDLLEGNPAGTGTVSIPGTLPANVVVSLASSDSTQATVPSSVTIYAGQTSASFSVTAVDDTLLDGSQPVTLTASATGFPAASATTSVADNDLASFAMGVVASPRVRNAPFAVTVTARDINGIVIPNYASELTLGAATPSGTVPFSQAPGSNFSSGVWTGNITIGTYADAVRLTAAAGDVSVTSNAFSVGRGPLKHFNWAQIASPQTLDTPFLVSLRAEDAGGNLVDDFKGAASLAAFSQSPAAPTGTGTSFVYDDLDPFFSQSRFQCIYTPEEIGGASRMTALQLNIATPPDIPLENFTIRVKRTPLKNYNSSASGWETSGWTVLYHGTATFSAEGWFTFPFSAPFDYDGTGNLMLDFSFNNPDFSFGWEGGYLATDKSDIRKLSYHTFSGGDPLAWSDQTTPAFISNQLPNLRFYGYNVTSPIRPEATGAFSGGLWSGYVSVPFTSDAMQLAADDGAGHMGTSNDFAVKAAKRAAGTGTYLAEDFEKNPLENTWAFTGTNSFRAQVTSANSPHGGTGQLILDSSSYSPSRTEATWTTDLSGLQGLTLKFWAKGRTNYSSYPQTSPFTGGADFDGVAISTNGTTWYIVQSLSALTSAWKQYTLDLDSTIASLGLSYNSSFKIRFNHYGYDDFYYSGIAVDDIEITGPPSVYAMRVTGPATMREGDAPTRCLVTLPTVPTVDTVVTLASSAPAKATVPSQITIPSGRLSGSFFVQPVSDLLIDGPKTVAITATSQTFPAGSFSFVMRDNDPYVLTLNVPVTSVTEGDGPIPATINISPPAASPIVFNVASSTPSAISVPTTVTIPLGATTAALPLTVVDDSKVDGTQTATITVSDPGTSSAESATISVADNETHDLQLLPSISPPPTTVNEGAGSISFSAKLPGSVTTATTLNFSSSSPAKIIPPAATSISSGGISTTVGFTIVDDTSAQVPEPVTLTVSATGFNDSSYVVTFLDNDPHHFTFAPIASPQVRGATIPVKVTACDANGAPVAGFLGPVALGTTGPGVLPASLEGFEGGVWSGTVRINEAANGVMLMISLPQAHTSTSNPFDVGNGNFEQLAWAPISPVQFPASNIPVTLQAVDAGGNIDSTVSEPVTVQALTPVPTATIGAGSTTTSSFLNAYYARARAEILYLAGELGGRRKLGGIALNVKSGAASQQFSNFTIRLKTTTRTKLDSTTGWDGDGWTAVHSSQQIISANGWITLLFDTPFEYDGQKNLLADYSYNSATDPGDSIYWAADYISGDSRMIYGYDDSSSATDPLTWSGTGQSSYVSYYLPQTRLLTLQPFPANIPSPQAINAGTWSSAISFGGNVDRVFLEAVDQSGHHGISSAFQIGSRPPATVTTLPFTEGFETGTLSSAWIRSGTGNGRTQVLSSNTPHGGVYHAVLDSSSGTARTELTLPLDLAGYSGVSLSFWTKRFDSTDDGPPASPFAGGADFDGVAMSADGINWYEIQALRTMTTGTWTQFTVNLDAAAAARGLTYNSNFRIRFNQYGNDYVPYDGIAIDDVAVTGNPTNRLAMSLPAWIGENASPAAGTVTLSSAAASDTTVTLVSSSPLALTVPASVVIPAGQFGTTFAITPINNTTLNGSLSINVTATTNGRQTMATTELRDDDTGTLTLSAPATIRESAGTSTATLTLSQPAAGNLMVLLSSSLATLQIPASVLVIPGQTTVTIPLTITDDSKFNGPRKADLSATLGSWAAATASTTIIDDEDGSLYWSSAATANEGSSSSITLYTRGTLSSSLVVNLSSSDTSRLTVPATVTIPAGSSSVTVSVTGVNNSTVEGMKTVSITASAEGSPSASLDVSVYDNDASSFAFAPISSSKFRSTPFPVSISAYDLDGRLISNYSATLPITATGDAGTISRSPTVITFANGTWNGNITLGTVSENVRLSVFSGIYTGTSSSFSVIPQIPASYIFGSIGATQSVAQPFTTTITAKDLNNINLPGYSGYVRLSAAASERTIGSGTATNTSFPINAYYPVERTQILYLASEVGAAGPLYSLSLYIGTVPGVPLTSWTIRLKNSPLTSYPVIQPWDSSGWTTVYSANQTISQNGWVTFNFTTPFAYDGISSLMVDLSFKNPSYFPNNYGAVRTFTAAANRTLYAYTSSSTNPTTWTTSPVPTLSKIVPQIKFNLGAASVSVSPATVLLTNGTWTGNLRISAVTPGISLNAYDFASATGKSGIFSVVASPDTDSDGLPDFWETANNLATANKAGDDGAMGDPDRDNIPNLLEYAFNLNPRAPDTGGLPFSVKMANPADGEDYLEFTYRRRIGAVGITYTIETSADCTTWSPATSQYQTAAGPLATGDGASETITVRLLPKISSPGIPVKFVRLRVSTP